MACEKGWHDMCSGKQPPPTGMLGGSECICKGDCKPRTMERALDDARKIEQAFREANQ